MYALSRQNSASLHDAICGLWQARLPHGIVSIRDHIEKVDNVPLLVSLFTDATPQTTKDMIGIYQEYHESVLAVGMSHRSEKWKVVVQSANHEHILRMVGQFFFRFRSLRKRLRIGHTGAPVRFVLGL